MTKDELRKQLQNILGIAAFLAGLTPNPVDNAVVAFLQQAASQDWVLDLLLRLINKEITLDEAKALYLSGVAAHAKP